MTRTEMIERLEALRNKKTSADGSVTFDPFNEGDMALFRGLVQVLEALQAEEAQHKAFEAAGGLPAYTLHISTKEGAETARKAFRAETITPAEIASASLPERNSNAANSIANNTIRATQYTQAALTLEDRVTAMESAVQALIQRYAIAADEQRCRLVGEIKKMTHLKKSGGAQ